MRQREEGQRAQAAHADKEKSKSAELRAAELIQARWRMRQYKKGRRSSPHARKKHEKAKTKEEKEKERAAVMMQARQRGATARRAAAGKSVTAYGGSMLQSAEARRSELEDAVTAAGALIGKFSARMMRKKQARKWVKEEQRKRNEAAATLQAAQRGKRIRKFLGYRGMAEREHGRPHGKGRMVWPDGSCYEGEWSNGLMSGEGEMVWSDGSSYRGGWRGGERSGRGIFENQRGDVHEGEWLSGKEHGPGVLTLLNGSVTVGSWSEGMVHGHVKEVLRSEDGSEWLEEYEGGCIDGDRHGPGMSTSALGTYEGMWEHGQRHGVGKFTTSDGCCYRGQWKNGVREGKGVLQTAMGHRFSGDWRDDYLPMGTHTGRFIGRYTGHFKPTGLPEWPLMRDGKGTWEGLSGDKYDGKWKDDYYEGLGLLKTRFAVYEGEFHRGQRHGYGVLVATNGDWYEGEFHHDAFDGEGERSDRSGVYVGQFLEGKRHGNGVFTTHQGVKYIGQWQHGKREGQGEQRFPDGSSFVGQWASDQKVGHGQFIDGFKGAKGEEISYAGHYQEGVRHGDGAEWQGMYGDHYRGGFDGGEMRGVGKFDFADGQEYLGCWLAAGTGQMPRRMSAIKRATLGAKTDAAGSPVAASPSEAMAAAGLSDPRASPTKDTTTTAAERVNMAQMPEAVKALKGALLEGGLAMMNTGKEGGAGRQAGSISKRGLGQKERKTAAFFPQADAAPSAASTRMMSAAAQQKNPLARMMRASCGEATRRRCRRRAQISAHASAAAPSRLRLRRRRRLRGSSCHSFLL